jgi:SAM-dependent methyltransferase
MTDYVIRGGEHGKARLHVIGEVLGPSTAPVLTAAGIDRGMTCLDLGCGGGDVTLAMADMVGPDGRVVGIDMDSQKIALAQQDARERGLANVELRCGDATNVELDDGYDVVYARLLLTHLREAAAVLDRMVAAAKPGGAVVVEDLDHTAVFAYPRCPALERYLALYEEVARRRGGDPAIGPKLAMMLRRAGVADVRVQVVQPIFLDGEAKNIHLITLENVRDPIIDAGLATADELGALAREMDDFAGDPDTIVAFPRIFQAFGRRPATA